MFSIRFSMMCASLALGSLMLAPDSQAAMATMINSGENSSCGVTTAGAAMCWGHNNAGQLGNGNQIDSAVPVGVTGLGSGVRQVAVGVNHACAVLVDGTARCWGWNVAGQLGNGTVTNTSVVPVQVTGLTGAIAIAAGWAQGCAVLATGIVKCWGANNAGQLGDGTLIGRTTPVEVLGINNAIGVSIGWSHACVVLNTGRVNCWGQNGNGQLGDGTTVTRITRVEVLGISDAESVVVGANHTCAKTTSGAVKCWGRGASGALGNGGTTDSAIPVAVTGLSSGVAQISAAPKSHSSCAVLSDGSAKCWGDNTYGILGTGDRVGRLLPTTVVGLAGPVSSITIGVSVSCARVRGGVQCWGDNSLGQHGAGNTAQVSFPQNAVGLFGSIPTILPVTLSPVTSRWPVYTWKAIPGASSYRLRINGVTTSYTAAAVNCPDGVGLCTFASGLLAPGVYGWQVQGFSEYGDGQWSALTQFML